MQMKRQLGNGLNRSCSLKRMPVTAAMLDCDAEPAEVLDVTGQADNKTAS